MSESGMDAIRLSSSLLHGDAHNRGSIRDFVRRSILTRDESLDKPAVKLLDSRHSPVALGVDNKGRKIYSTREQILTEIDLKKRAGEMAGDGKHSMDINVIERAITAKKTMSEEQADAVRWAFSPGSLKIVEGAAGSGKSFSLDVAREAFESQGYQMHGIALSWQASRVLQESAGIESRAITGFLSELDSGKLKLNDKSVIVCDENGLVGSVYGQRILKHAQEAGAKVIITGDEEQLNPVQAGPAMKLMKEVAGSVKITEIRRQKDQWQRDMVFNFSKGNSREAMAELQANGKVNLLESKRETINKVAQDYYDFLKTQPGKTALALAGSNEDSKQLNIAIRELKRADGLIGKTDILIKNTIQGDLNFAVGDKVMFRKNDKKNDIINRTVGSLLGIETFSTGYKVNVLLEDGRKVTVDSRKYQDDEGRFAMHHGDAMTIYSSQGATVNNSFVMHSSSMDRRLAYVAYSRHKDSTTLYIDKSEAVNKMKTNLSADEFESFSATQKDILDDIVKQYHNRSEKDSTLDYLTESQVDMYTKMNEIEQAAEQNRISEIAFNEFLAEIEKAPQHTFEEQKDYKFDLEKEFERTEKYIDEDEVVRDKKDSEEVESDEKDMVEDTQEDIAEVQQEEEQRRLTRKK